MAMFMIVGNDGLQRFEPKWLEAEQVWTFMHGCPAASPTGCIIPHDKRPMMCKIFPFIAIPVYTDIRQEAHLELFLHTARCPNWKAFGDNYEAIKQEFENGSKEN